MTDPPDSSPSPEPPVGRAWPYALLLAIFNFVLGAILINGSVRLGPAVGLVPVAIEIVIGLILRRTNPRGARILLLAPLMMLAIAAGLFVFAWGICSSMKF